MDAIAVLNRTVSRQVIPDREVAAWQQVPVKVAKIVTNHSRTIRTLRKLVEQLPKSVDHGYIFFNPDTKSVHAVLSDGDDEPTYNKWHNTLKAVTGVNNVTVEAEGHPSNPDDWILVKKSAARGMGVLLGFEKRALDSPNSLATTLAGGLIGGGLGWGAGKLLGWLFPEDYVDKDQVGRLGLILGAGAGAVPGLWSGINKSKFIDPQTGQPAGLWKGFTRHVNTLQTPPDLQADMDAYRASQGTGLPKIGSYVPDGVDDWLVKAAQGFVNPTTAGTSLQSVPLDAFGRAIWNDVHNYASAARNPYGTKSPWGTNEQPMYTPPAVGAAMSGIVSGIGAQYGSPPSLLAGHFGRGLVAAGVDTARAKVAGGILGALGVLKPAGQKQLQQMGLWGGLMRGLAGSLLGR